MTIEDAFMRVFGDLIRQGPGTTMSSLRALEIVRPLLPPAGEVLDVGCGTGARPGCWPSPRLRHGLG
ncbi:MAG: hypothetical protein HC909_02570, partial [Blastochloris sp.]|nr:hypothetical protein [Blastochloris sp.]